MKHMQGSISKVLALASALALTGCGTYASLEHPNANNPLVFGGIRTNIDVIEHGPSHNGWLSQQRLYNPYVDLPLSAIADTFMFPYVVLTRSTQYR